MSSIHKLSPETIAKISAGEVIERPVFAVKELIENAIDAASSDIVITIEKAGLVKIQVQDNGIGMARDDLLLSFLPHTTSKLPDENLHTIGTLGFRGEALASLASVSRLTIKSRTKKEAIGHMIEIAFGKLQKEKPIGMPIGTIVTAENLFGNLPARKKFLKSPPTELRHIIELVDSFALAYPKIAFTLFHNKKKLMHVGRAATIEERIQEILGNNFSLLLPLQKEYSFGTIAGFVAKPQLHSSTSAKQFLFVNNRSVSDKLISAAVKESFGTMLESNDFPVFILFFTMPFAYVDVNVHPRKEQVSFGNAQAIFQAVKESITETLQENNITFQNLSWMRKGVGTTNSFAGKLLRRIVLDKELSVQSSFFVQYNKTYILAATDTGILLVDQHGAHERILFEKLKKEFAKQNKKQKSFVLQEPVVLSLTPSEQILLTQHTKMLKKLGYAFVTKKTQSILTNVPYLLQDRNPQELLDALLTTLQQEKNIPSIDTTSEEMLAFLACRRAVKAGDTLTSEKMKDIVQTLQSTRENATCPHGRPTSFLFPMEYINSLFKRN